MPDVNRLTCQFEPVPGIAGRWKCSVCGIPTSDRKVYDSPPTRRCTAVPKTDRELTLEGRVHSARSPGAELRAPPPPSVFKKLTHFAPALIGHVLGGMPTCSGEQIDARLTICRACPGDHYLRDSDNPNLGVCTNCGCSAGREEKFLNKLAWADQECPIGAWRKLTK